MYICAKKVRDSADDVAAKKIDESVALRRPENDTRCAQCRSNIDNRFRRGWTNRIAKERRLIAGFFFLCGENTARLGVFLPFAFTVVLGQEGLFAHEK